MTESRDGLVLQQDGEAFEVIDPALGQWAVRIEEFAQPPRMDTNQIPPSMVVLLSSLVQRFPEIQKVIGKSTGVLRVAFSPEIQRALSAGQYRLMESAAGLLPTAVDSSGRIAAHARVVSATAGQGVMAAGGATGGAAVAGAAIVAWPIVLAAAVGVAAAYAEQRWLEQTFDELRQSLARIEARLRDDDFGTLDAADALVDVLRGSTLLEGNVPNQLSLELALARRDVEAIYFSRRRFVERFKQDLEQRQVAHEARRGDRRAWVEDLAREVGGKGRGLIDELVVFVRAMITRARLASCVASGLAYDGESELALRLLDSLEQSTRRDYHDLHNRVRALSRSSPETPVWRRLPGLSSDDVPRALAGIQWLEREMQRTIGRGLPERDQVLSLPIPMAELQALMPVPA